MTSISSYNSMKRRISIIITLALIALAGSLHTGAVTNAELTQIARKLCNAFAKQEVIPADKNYKNILTADFERWMLEGNDVPSQTPGDAGEEDTMYYWFVAQEYCPTDGVKSVKILTKTATSFTANVTYRNCEQVNSHRVSFKKENGVWLIDDINHGKEEVRNYVNKSYDIFSNGGAQKILSDPDLSGWMNAQARKEYQSSVDNYLKKWGPRH